MMLHVSYLRVFDIITLVDIYSKEMVIHRDKLTYVNLFIFLKFINRVTMRSKSHVLVKMNENVINFVVPYLF